MLHDPSKSVCMFGLTPPAQILTGSLVTWIFSQCSTSVHIYRTLLLFDLRHVWCWKNKTYVLMQTWRLTGLFHVILNIFFMLLCVCFLVMQSRRCRPRWADWGRHWKAVWDIRALWEQLLQLRRTTLVTTPLHLVSGWLYSTYTVYLSSRLLFMSAWT